MATQEKHVVTGALGYSGKYITKLLLDNGHNVYTLTNSPNRPNPFGDKLTVHTFNFEQPEKLIESLKGTDVLYNTYWVRFNSKTFKHSVAVDNTLLLLDAAKKAGVKRIVHTSITNPSLDSKLEYFHGKAVLEKSLKQSGIPYTILRPAVIFGDEDILINNIAWMLRKLPVIGVFGKGDYRLQPIFVEDFARLAVEEGKQTENRIVDATGPETFSYKELIKTIGEIIEHKRPIISVPDFAGYFVAWLIGKFVGDVVLTRPEIEGLKSDLLATDAPPAGTTKLTDWIKENKNTVGKKYANEMKRRIDRTKNYN